MNAKIIKWTLYVHRLRLTPAQTEHTHSWGLVRFPFNSSKWWSTIAHQSSKADMTRWISCHCCVFRATTSASAQWQMFQFTIAGNCYRLYCLRRRNMSFSVWIDLSDRSQSGTDIAIITIEITFHTHTLRENRTRSNDFIQESSPFPFMTISFASSFIRLLIFLVKITFDNLAI